MKFDTKRYKIYRNLDEKPEKVSFSEIKNENPSGFPTTYISKTIMEEGIPAFILFEMCDLCDSRAASRRLLKQGGGYAHIHGTKYPIQFKIIEKFDKNIKILDFEDNFLYLRAGKKKIIRIKLC